MCSNHHLRGRELENTPRETAEEPVLLRWDLPAEKRSICKLYPFQAVFWLLWVGYQLCYNRPASRAGDAALIVGVVFLALSIFAIRQVLLSGVGMACSRSGVEVTLSFGRPRHLRWAEIKMFKRWIFGSTVLCFDSSPYSFYLRIPPEVRDKLIAILRETSNARIIGFGPEGG